MGVLIFLAAIVVYFVVGVRYVARAYVIRAVQRDCEEFPLSAKDPNEIARWRRRAAGEGLFLVPVWPFYLFGRALVSGLVVSVPPTDAELRLQLGQRDRRIAELERELGIGRRP